MSLLAKLNIKPTEKAVKVGASLTIEKELNKFFGDVIKEAITTHPKYSKYFKRICHQRMFSSKLKKMVSQVLN